MVERTWWWLGSSQSVIQSIGQLVSDWRAMAGRPEEEGMVVAWQQGSDWSEDVTDVWTLSRAYRIFAIGRRCNVLWRPGDEYFFIWLLNWIDIRKIWHVWMDGWNGTGRGGTSLGHINSSHTMSAYILRHACTSTMQYSYGEGLRRERDRDLILLSMDSRTDLTTARQADRRETQF